MPKLYEDKPRNDELFLRLWQDGGKVELDMVDDNGRWQAVLARIDGNGLHLAGGADPRCAARAGMADAFDANGRLKVIGGGGEADAEAERMEAVTYNGRDHGRMRVRRGPSSVCFDVMGLPGRLETVSITNDDLVDLHARLGRHIAFIKKEGKL